MLQEKFTSGGDIEESVQRGNPIASMRYRWQTWTIIDDEPLESEWAQTLREAIGQAQKHLIWSFKKFGKDDMVVKIFNVMNYRQKPIIITLEVAQKQTNKLKTL